MDAIVILILIGLLFIAGHALIMVIYFIDIRQHIQEIIEILKNKER